MPDFIRPDFKPYQTLTAPTLNELKEQVERLTSVYASNGYAGASGISTAFVDDGDGFLVKIDDADEMLTPIPHSWREMIDDPTTPGAYQYAVNGMTGQLTSMPLYEMNGNRIPNAQVVRVYRGMGPYYIASYSPHDLPSLTPGSPNERMVTDAGGVAAVWRGGVFDKSANYTVVLTDSEAFLNVDCSANDVTITLPPLADANPYFHITVRRVDSSSHVLTVDGHASETINDDLTILMPNRYQRLEFIALSTTKWSANGEFSTIHDNVYFIYDVIINMYAANFHIFSNTTILLEPDITLNITGGDLLIESSLEICGEMFWCSVGKTLTNSGQVEDDLDLHTAGEKIVYKLTSEENLDRDITGIEFVDSDQVIAITNMSDCKLTLRHDGSTSTLGNRFSLPQSRDLILRQFDSAILHYNFDVTSWVVLASSTNTQTPGDANQYWVTNSAGDTALWMGGVSTKTEDFAIVGSDHLTLFSLDATSGALTATLPLGSTVGVGFRFYAHKKDSAYTARILAAGSDSIDGVSDRYIGPPNITFEFTCIASDKWTCVAQSLPVASLFQRGTIIAWTSQHWDMLFPPSDPNGLITNDATQTTGLKWFPGGSHDTYLTINTDGGLAWQQIYRVYAGKYVNINLGPPDFDILPVSTTYPDNDVVLQRQYIDESSGLRVDTPVNFYYEPDNSYLSFGEGSIGLRIAEAQYTDWGAITPNAQWFEGGKVFHGPRTHVFAPTLSVTAQLLPYNGTTVNAAAATSAISATVVTTLGRHYVNPVGNLNGAVFTFATLGYQDPGFSETGLASNLWPNHAIIVVDVGDTNDVIFKHSGIYFKGGLNIFDALNNVYVGQTFTLLGFEFTGGLLTGGSLLGPGTTGVFGGGTAGTF